MTDMASTIGACQLPPASLRVRVVQIAELARAGLRDHRIEGSTLHLFYAPHVAARVRDMVRREQECRPFLAFEFNEKPDVLKLTITAPASGAQKVEETLSYFLPAPPQPQQPCHPSNSGAQQHDWSISDDETSLSIPHCGDGNCFGHDAGFGQCASKNSSYCRSASARYRCG